MSVLWEVEEADREAAERARVAQWVAEHPDPVTAALARATAAEVEVARLRELLVEGDEDEDEGYSVRCGRAVCDDANPHRSGCRCYKDAEHDGMHGCEHADWPVHGLDHIARATEVLARVGCQPDDEPSLLDLEYARALDEAGLLTSPAHDAAVAARALRAAQSDIKARIRHMGRYGASGDYISALNDAWGLLNNRVRDIEHEGGAS